MEEDPMAEVRSTVTFSSSGGSGDGIKGGSGAVTSKQ